MQLVINIDEKIYESVMDGTYCGTLYQELKNGTPLPKGHGKIGDLDRLYNVFEKNVVSADIFKELFDHAPTIIEADEVEE